MRRFLALVLLASSFSCASPSEAPSSPPPHEYTFVFLRTGPQRANYQGEPLNEVMRGHMANIGRLASKHQLFVAGPFGAPSPDARLRGLFVLATTDVGAATQMLQTDPSIATGVLQYELAPWSTRADLAAALERGLEFEERRKADPSIPMTDGMTSYVLVFADDGARASQALAPLRAQHALAFEGEFGGRREGQALFALDARDLPAAESLLAPVRDNLGSHQLFPWWGSVELRK